MPCDHRLLAESSTCRGTNHELAGRGLPQRVYHCSACDRDVWVDLPALPEPRVVTLPGDGARKPPVRPPSPAGYRNRGGNRKTHGTFVPGAVAKTTPKYSVALPPREQRTLKPWVSRRGN